MRAGDRKLYRPPSGWEIEVGRFRELLARWLEYRLNRLFDLSLHGPAVRKYWALVLGVGFVAAGFAVHTALYFFPILAPPAQVQLSSLPLFFLLTIARLVLVLLIPPFIALTMAGEYLADVFELKHPSVAWEFIRQLSLGGAGSIVHIRDGKVSEESLESPVILIGGPGVVLAEFDSAALFEKPDGTPHVVGLGNADQEGNVAHIVLDGFERLREPIVSLRDQYLGSPSGEPMTVAGRSRDGLPISAADVRCVFSLRRAHQADVDPQSLRQPFAFESEDIESLIYKQAVPVLTGSPYPSGQPSAWTDTMMGLIRGSLGEFMSQHDLAEYLAGIGAPEVERAEFHEDTILAETLRVTSELPDSTSPGPTAPKFHPRTELLDRFTRPGDAFTRRSQEHGLELHWIGVGTWRIPNDLTGKAIEDQHLEAWRLGEENAGHAGEGALASGFDEAYINERIRLIQNVPLAAHEKNQTRYSEKEVLAECLLQDYWEQMGSALEIYYNNGARPAELLSLEKAVLRIEWLLRIPRGQHVIGGGQLSKVKSAAASANDEEAPPAPSSKHEAVQYRLLLSKLDGNYRVAEGMIENEARRHPTQDREQLISRIVKRLERYGH